MLAHTLDTTPRQAHAMLWKNAEFARDKGAWLAVGYSLEAVSPRAVISADSCSARCVQLPLGAAASFEVHSSDSGHWAQRGLRARQT